MTDPELEGLWATYNYLLVKNDIDILKIFSRCSSNILAHIIMLALTPCVVVKT